MWSVSIRAGKLRFFVGATERRVAWRVASTPVQSSFSNSVGAVRRCKPLGRCAVERRFLSMGAKPTQQLSFRLVAARAGHGGNNMG